MLATETKTEASSDLRPRSRTLPFFQLLLQAMQLTVFIAVLKKITLHSCRFPSIPNHSSYPSPRTPSSLFFTFQTTLSSLVGGGTSVFKITHLQRLYLQTHLIDIAIIHAMCTVLLLLTLSFPPVRISSCN